MSKYSVTVTNSQGAKEEKYFDDKFEIRQYLMSWEDLDNLSIQVYLEFENGDADCMTRKEIGANGLAFVGSIK